jgi:hypothetical protein
MIFIFIFIRDVHFDNYVNNIYLDDKVLVCKLLKDLIKKRNNERVDDDLLFLWRVTPFFFLISQCIISKSAKGRNP